MCYTVGGVSHYKTILHKRNLSTNLIFMSVIFDLNCMRACLHNNIFQLNITLDLWSHPAYSGQRACVLPVSIIVSPQ